MLSTGWTGGPYGVGKRIDLTYTREMIAAAVNGSLDQISFTSHPVFGIKEPASRMGVPAEFWMYVINGQIVTLTTQWSNN
jgi:phosphoenolpyruvate carboxykinase (ATP)